MAVRKKQELELEISDIAFGGKGLAKVDGFAIFVDQAVPSDRVRVRITRKKKNYAEARIIEMIAPSPLRIDPPCRYSGYCGGCKWQFLDYDTQLHYKQRHVAESLEHIGLIEGVPVHAPVPSEKIFGYRNKMEFSCSDRRWLMPDELGREEISMGFAIGLHVPGTFHKVLDTEACLIQPELGNAILGDVREYIRASDRPVYGLRTHEGFWRFLMLRHSVAYDQWMVNIITSAEDRAAVQPLADRLTEKYPDIISVVNNITARKAGIAVGESEIRLAGAPVIRDKIGPYEFEISANSFFQTNTRGAARLYDIVKQYAELTGNETVFDLYCGTGTISICLSDAARDVIGIELAESSVADARKNCERNNISNCRFISGDIKDCLEGVGVTPDVMVIDPPRVGMHKDVVRQVLEIGPERIVYVSCNPATLARDLAMIKDAYQVLEVTPVDMFPHTWHIESVAKLRKK
ncbi:23S rRNA (uracil(1939)-C(5))-methyltransferase R lmD [Desulfonema ishimotonii]|uniref:23S rRNA (Uracil(1939)-C(5))-methyltransferase R lmD n=1 Tax=Desulfonema ishimotonii TaxID=45657 RepID=A0A401FWJ5_9BACT|nr:23S rRNA (uracil(1939)-C(5))-methyltransferase RlmD [Desulfonema ishimotonii]GBC61336.1 23S rRNA (uracil(1939)-C(5))-methyltransferase R lmD [Desulfonema ishimotonii]